MSTQLRGIPSGRETCLSWYGPALYALRRHEDAWGWLWRERHICRYVPRAERGALHLWQLRGLQRMSHCCSSVLFGADAAVWTENLPRIQEGCLVYLVQNRLQREIRRLFRRWSISTAMTKCHYIQHSSKSWSALHIIWISYRKTWHTKRPAVFLVFSTSTHAQNQGVCMPSRAVHLTTSLDWLSKKIRNPVAPKLHNTCNWFKAKPQTSYWIKKLFLFSFSFNHLTAHY
jgi:hypothetical protein